MLFVPKCPLNAPFNERWGLSVGGRSSLLPGSRFTGCWLACTLLLLLFGVFAAIASSADGPRPLAACRKTVRDPNGHLQGLSTFARSKLPCAVTPLLFGAHSGVRIFVSSQYRTSGFRKTGQN